MHRALIVFVKEPRPGAVKSRLAARIGAEAAAALYRAIADEEIRCTAPRGDEYERLFFFDPPAARAAMAAWLPGESLFPQPPGDLGQRMSAAFAEAFRLGARRVAIIGTDVPWAAREDVLDALEGLDEHDLVIGPATDGGYYLLALKRLEPGLFLDVPWSTPGVLAATLDRAAALSLGVRTLRTLGDLDTAEDVAADWRRLAPLLPAALRAELAALLRPTSSSS
ncbi:MAG TPA: TIGR04282 family arsenosugar biosynthesis glycosyltransferase [Vicinamibacteria bacterium]|nr:TIGR04282 family arsenosugar biosynthesis glycosyltransferase [Vicinamibacteria bacterium]